MLDPQSSEFKVTHLEMIKGIEGHGFYGNCVVPIIENTARECELTDRLRQAIKDHPQANAVLVRRHGVYVWGKDWIQAKTQAECYDYLFEAAVRMHGMGIDASRPPPPMLAAAGFVGTADGNRPAPDANGSTANGAANGTSAKRIKSVHRQRLPAAIVLDIEGTVVPISFVADVLFPYAREHVTQHLRDTYGEKETQEDIAAIKKQMVEDVLANDLILSEDKQHMIDNVVEWVQHNIANDRKVGALKQLQGHIWRSGFRSGQLVAPLFRDVPDALAEWRNLGIKTYIYSSGSREAQRLLFSHTQVGDLRPYLSGFFDTTSGPKVESSSYSEIALSLGVDSASDILFATDVVAEAEAAVTAGWQAVLVMRPGNKPVSEGHGFRVVESMQELLC
eukprot:jgi/Chrzof1/13011/Cz07g16110.t1